MSSFSNDQTLLTRHKPDFKEKLFFFISGIIISVPLTLYIDSFIEQLLAIEMLSKFYATLLTIAIFTPFIEEFAKAYPLFYRHGETERSIFILGFLVGLGFGISEFLVYVHILGVSPYIRLPGLFFHAASTSITAYGIATKRPVWFYLIAVFLHFSNNLSALVGSAWLMGGVGAVALAYFLSWYFYRKTTELFVD